VECLLHTIVPMLRTFALVFVCAAACRDATGSREEPAPAPAPTTETGSAAPATDPAEPDNGYVPAEYKTGLARFKDTVVYLDGKPIGYLNFGELPLALKPTWLKVKKSANKPANCDECLGWTWGEQRYYRFTDYLKVMGVPIAKIRQLHVQGPKPANSIVVTGAQLLSPAATDFLFHFGGETNGKAIPRSPLKFGNDMHPDKIASVMIYIAKQPPKLSEDGFVLDGHLVEGVPYYGEPLRGGVRIYLDEKLVAIIKRQELDVKQSKQGSGGTLAWSLYEFLKSKGVDTAKVVEGWVIRDERHKEKLPASELATTTFSASSQASGAVVLGDKKLATNALALYTRAVTSDELPQIRPEEDDN
jgi:hypothetical protein